MLSKISINKNKFSDNQNIYYFFKTPLLIIGSKKYEEFNEKIRNIYNNNILELEWIFENGFQLNEEKEVIIKISLYLNELIELMLDDNNINLQDLSCLQKNEEILLQQLYSTIKAIQFFEKLYNIKNRDYSYFLKIVEDYSSDRNPISLSNAKFKPFKILDESAVSILSLKMKYIHMKWYDEVNKGISSTEYFREINKVFKFKEMFNLENIDKRFKYALKNIIDAKIAKKIFNTNDINILGWIFIKTNLLENFRGKLEIIKDNNLKIFEEYLFVLMCLLMNVNYKSEIFQNALIQNYKESLARVPLSYLDRIFKDDDRISVITILNELIFCENLNWFTNENLELKKIIYRYANILLLKDQNKKYDDDLVRIKNYIYKEINIKNILIDTNKLYKEIIETFNENNYLAIDFAKYICLNLGSYNALIFSIYLNKDKKEEKLKDAIMWILSQKYFYVENHEKLIEYLKYIPRSRNKNNITL